MIRAGDESHNRELLIKDKGVLSRYLPWFFIGTLLLWIILLAIGAVAEIFNIQSILDWWIFRI